MIRLATIAAALLIALSAFAGPARAQDVIEIDEPLLVASATPIADAAALEAATLAADAQGPRPVAIQYSEGHETRAKIHKYTSIATLPLMVTEYVLGQQLYNDPNSINSSSRGVHGTIGAALIGVFAVQSVTGVWNLMDSKQAPGHKKRLVHGLMMLAAEGGFIAAAVTAPGHGRNDLINFDAEKSTHRNIAIFSIGIGTAGYLLMLFNK